MTTTSYDAQNKEDRENRFLSERIIQKALDQGKIDSASTNEIEKLFESVLAEHKGEAVRVRAELLMSTLRNHVVNKNEQSGVVDIPQKRSVPVALGFATEPVPTAVVDKKEDDELSRSGDGENSYEKDKALLQGTINKKIADADLSEELRSEAQEVVFSETQHIIDTKVSSRVVERIIDKELEVFKQKHNIGANQQEYLDDGTGQEKLQKKTEETDPRTKVEKEEDKKGTDDSTVHKTKQDAVQDPVSVKSTRSPQESPQDDDVAAGPVKKKKKTLVEIAMEKARKDDVSNPLKPNTMHWPTSTISFGTPVNNTAVRKNSVDNTKTAVMEKNLEKTHSALADPTNKNKPMPSTEVSAPEEAPTSPHTAKAKLKLEVKSKEVKKDKIQNNPESFSKTESQRRSSNNPASHDLSSSSNTKMVFDGSLELDSSRIETKHTLHKQNRELFDRYINEQVNIVMEVIMQNNDLPEDVVRGIRDDLVRKAIVISGDDNISISERMKLLDTFFHEQKREYAKKRVDNNPNYEKLIEEIMKRSNEDVDTDNKEADDRFRETLRNTLYFKAKHMVGSGQDLHSIDIALNEEYAKHKAFYIKNV